MSQATCSIGDRNYWKSVKLSLQFLRGVSRVFLALAESRALIATLVLTYLLKAVA